MSDASRPRQQKPAPFEQLRQQMAASFDLEGLQTLCFDIGINYDELARPGLAPKIRDLIQVMKRNGRISDLLTAVSLARPHINWPDLTDLEVDIAPNDDSDYPPNPQIVVSARGVYVGGDVHGNIHTGDVIIYQMSGTRPDSEGVSLPPFMYSPLQENFVERPNIMQEVSKRLLAKKGSVAIVGAGGAGKTTLTTRLCYEEAIHKAFPDGILWVKLGPELDPIREIFNRLTSLYQILTRKSIEPIDNEDAILKLATALRNKRCLIVIDDVWDIEHLRPFLQGGKECVHLITTRRNDIALEVDGSPIKLDKMTTEEATELLLQQLNPKPEEVIPFEQLAQRLGQWPLVLELTGKQLHQLISMGYTPDNALKYVNDAHDREGLTVFDRTAVIAKSLNISLELLDQEKMDARDYFCQLVVFPNTIDIPLPAISYLWGFDEYETRKWLHLMDNFSLLKFSSHAVRLHYLIYQYLTSQLDSKAEEVIYQKLLNGYNPFGKPWYEVVESVSDRNYLRDYLVYHLECAKRDEDVHKLFATDDWAKLRRTEELLSDFGNARQLAYKTGADMAIRIRYALFNEVVQQRYRNIPVEALPALMSNGTVAATLLMSALQAMQGDDEAKTRVYLEIVSRLVLSGTLQEDDAPHILKIAQGISDAESKARLAMELAVFLPDQLKHEAYRTIWQAIFEIESKEIRKELLERLWANLSKIECQQLQKDALAIKSDRRRIRVIYQIDRLLGEGQRDLWRATILSILKREYHSNDVYTFAALINHIPAALRPMLKQEAGEAIWQALAARTYWEDSNYFEFLEDVLEVLMPYVPAEYIEGAWEKAKWHRYDQDVAEWSMVTVAASPHFPEELIPEFQKMAASMRWGSYPARLLLASRLPTDKRASISLDVWLSAVKEHLFSVVLGKLANQLRQQPETITWQIWKGTQPSLQELDRFDAKTVLSILARIVPLTKITEAYLDCFQFKLRPLGTEDMRAEIIQILIGRLPPEQQEQMWDAVLHDALEKYPLLDRRLDFAIEIIKQTPENWRQEKWNSILQHIRSAGVSEDSVRLLTKIVPDLPTQEQSQIWLGAWSLTATTDKYNRWIQYELLKHLPPLYYYNRGSKEFITQLGSLYIDVEALIGSDSSYNEFYHSDVQAGFALLLLHAPQSFILNVWEKEKAHLGSSFNHLWMLMPILPCLSSEQQEQLLPMMLRAYNGPLPEIGTYLIANWPEKIMKRAWETLCTTFPDDLQNQNTYPDFAYALIPHLPESYRLAAWRLALNLITPTFWNEWPEICETVLRSLPDEDVSQARDDLLEITRINPRFLFSSQLERILAPRLPDERIGTLVQTPQGNNLFSETIFTCSLAQYLQQGGLFGVDLQEELEAHFQEAWPKYSSIIRILLQLWSYLAYLFVPLLYLTTLFLSDLKKIPGLEKAGRSLRFLGSEVFVFFYLLTPRKLRRVWDTIGWPLAMFGALISPYQKIASYYALPKSQAYGELEKVLLVEKDITMELIEARPLIQRVGGVKLRRAMSAAYKDAHTWWRECF